jgi:hypothetical protein
LSHFGSLKGEKGWFEIAIRPLNALRTLRIASCAAAAGFLILASGAVFDAVLVSSFAWVGTPLPLYKRQKTPTAGEFCRGARRKAV